MVTIQRLRLHTFDIGDVIKAGGEIWLRRFPTIAAIVLMTQVPVSLVIWYLEDANQGFVWDLFAPMAATLLKVLGIMALIFLVEREICGQPVDLRGAMDRAFDRWSAGVATTALVIVIAFVAVLLLIVPAIIVAVFLAFTLPAVVLRNRSGLDALRYSKALVSGQWWRVFGYSLGVGLVAFALPLLGYVLARVWGSTNAAADFAPSFLADFAISFRTVAITVFFLHVDFIAHPHEVPENPDDAPEAG